jgi:hypothetical protein
MSEAPQGKRRFDIDRGGGFLDFLATLLYPAFG